MKFNLNRIKKINHLIIAFIIFIYLIICIINNNFNETFIIFTILIIGYILINHNIFYILLLFIIINSFFLKSNKFNEGLTNNNRCSISPDVEKLIRRTNKDTAVANQNPVVNVLETDASDILPYVKDAYSGNEHDIKYSDDCQSKMSNSEPDISLAPRSDIPTTCNNNYSDLLNSDMKYDSYN